VLLSYEKANIPNKLSKFYQITGIINQVPKRSNFQKQTTLRTYSTIAVPTLLYSDGTWTLKEKDIPKSQQQR
jgi:hypothetical protein